MASGPLTGLRVLELAGIGPAPFAAMLLSDLGADVVRIDRPGAGAAKHDVTARGRRSLALNLKADADRETLLNAAEKADVLIEGFRPGVLERLGLGPDVLLARNPRLVVGRMTGWGQDGPLAERAGHDIAYIALTGALDAIGPKGGPPVPPLNLVGDYGGGALYLAFGIVAALLERERSGQGQVIDAAVVDGTASLMAIFHWFAADGMSRLATGEGFLAGAAPFYRCYRCADGEHVAVGPIEPQFYAELLARLDLAPDALGGQHDEAAWPEAHAALEARFAEKPRADWLALFEDSDACVAPVLSLNEAPEHPHMKARGVYVEVDGQTQPAPAPRFSRTPGGVQGPPPAAGEGGAEALKAWGVEA